MYMFNGLGTKNWLAMECWASSHTWLLFRQHFYMNLCISCQGDGNIYLNFIGGEQTLLRIKILKKPKCAFSTPKIICFFNSTSSWHCFLFPELWRIMAYNMTTIAELFQLILVTLQQASAVAFTLTRDESGLINCVCVSAARCMCTALPSGEKRAAWELVTQKAELWLCWRSRTPFFKQRSCIPSYL